MISFSTFKRDKFGLLTQHEVDEPVVDYGVSVTDKSHYNPNAASFVANTGALNARPLYDFPDGVSNGLRMSLFHAKNLDVTEKEALFERLKTQTNERLRDLLELSPEPDPDPDSKPDPESSEPVLASKE